MNSQILIALGGNLPFDGASVMETFEFAIDFLSGQGVQQVNGSRWYRSTPVPVSNQPDFINGVVAIRTRLDPESLLSLLHETEKQFGRVRHERNEARTLDLDLIDYRGRISAPGGHAPVLPHPRMTDRAFVLLPLRDVMPDWRHPVTGETIAELLEALPQPWGASPL